MGLSLTEKERQVPMFSLDAVHTIISRQNMSRDVRDPITCTVPSPNEYRQSFFPFREPSTPLADAASMTGLGRQQSNYRHSSSVIWYKSGGKTRSLIELHEGKGWRPNDRFEQRDV